MEQFSGKRIYKFIKIEQDNKNKETLDVECINMVNMKYHLHEFYGRFVMMSDTNVLNKYTCKNPDLSLLLLILRFNLFCGVFFICSISWKWYNSTIEYTHQLAT